MRTRLRSTLTAVDWKRFLRWASEAALVSLAVWVWYYKVFQVVTRSDEPVWGFVVRQAGLLANRPIGFILLCFAVWIAACFGFLLFRAWWETREPVGPIKAELGELRVALEKEKQKNKPPEQSQPPALTIDQENLAHFARLFWQDTAARAIHRAILLAQKLQETLKPTDTSIDLISYPLIELDAVRHQMWELLEFRQTQPDIVMSGLRRVIERYMTLVQWINYYRDSCATDFDSPPYSEPNTEEDPNWPNLHQRFREEFGVLCARPGFEALRNFYSFKMAGDRRVTPPTGLGEKGRALDLLFRQLSPTETQFLKLLVPDSHTYDQPGSSLLPHEVYNAGNELARKGVFAIRELTEGGMPTSVFTVPNHVAPFLKRHLFATSETRMEVRLRLDRVAGSGASGSGARGSF